MIPQSAWDSPSANAMKLIPDPNNGVFYSTSGYPSTLQDDKAGATHRRQHANWTDFRLLALRPVDERSALCSVWRWLLPRFSYLDVGKAQLFTFGVTTNFGGAAVNQFTASYMRNTNVNGLPATKGPTLQSLGFAPPNAGGIYQLEGPAYQNWP